MELNVPNPAQVQDNQTDAHDLSNISEQVKNERDFRSLALRKLFNRDVPKIHHKARGKLSLQQNIQVTDLETAISIFQSNDLKKIQEVSQELAVAAHVSPNSISLHLKSPEFLQLLANFLTNQNYPPEALISVIKAIAEIFPLCGELQNDFVDEISMSLLDLLNSPIPDIVGATMILIRVICSVSEYARDAVLCLGIYSRLFEITSQQISPLLTITGCQTLHAIFATDGEVDTDVINICINSLVKFLDLPLKTEVSEILGTLIEITNKVPSLVFRLFEMGISQKLINFLSDPELRDAALRLIGNMCVSQPEHVKELLEEHLFEHLIALFNAGHVSDSLWIFSNLLESIPEVICPMFTGDFIQQLVQMKENCPYDVKKEIAYLLGTLITFASDEMAVSLIRPDIVDVLVEMLGCGTPLIILRCMSAIIACFHIITTTGNMQLMSAFDVEDLKDRLKDLCDFNDEMVEERAFCMLSQLEKLEEISK
ncbi:hypothetical protein GPJ56_000678 [Histomonas meleagridis]|uniref:uncharacterized protein n=1 Tax=Histomonas meleagridis TaxID=135588 RepID=UPI00355953C6|nr:hypothetical protein GPJ56_000678 [Histomonas meleagridis]KAH0804807.1 hypothetical protein GO595_002501 [Histomonas meleagridis]